GAADARREARILRRPVGKVAILGDFERAQERHVEMAAADHQEGIVVVEEGAAGHQRGQALAGIDQVLVLLAGLRRRPHAEDAVLAMEHDLAVGGDEIRHHGGEADAEIDISAVGNVLRGAPRHLATGQRLHGSLLSHTTTTRSTKMPGVTMHSGSSAPKSTTSRTWTAVMAPAIAMTGLKFRADLRYVRLPQRSARSARHSAMSPLIGCSST